MLPPTIRFLQRGWHNSNSIIIGQNKHFVIVDTGHAEDALLLEAQLRSLGIEPSTINTIINTHCHWDHFGGNGHLKALSGAVVGMGPETADIMRRADHHTMWLSMFGTTADIQPPDFEINLSRPLELADLSFEVLHLPGHAPDSIAFYQPDHKVLICADALMDRGDCGILNVAVHGWELFEQVEQTLATLESLDVSIALPGHGPPITDFQAQVAMLRSRIAIFKSQPDRLCKHFARRAIMTSLIFKTQVQKTEFINRLLTTTWVHTLADIFQISAENLVQNNLQALIKGGAIKVDGPMLISQVPR